MRAKELGIKTLKLPLWFEIIFFCLTTLAPIALIVMEGLKAPEGIAGTAFRLSFMTICIAILVWTVLKKVWIDKMETKLIAKQTALEHDYSIDVGAAEKIRYLWYHNELKLTLFRLGSVALYGGLAVVILLGVASKLMEVKGLVMILASIYVIAYTLKFMVILKESGGDYVENENANTTTER